MSDANFAAILDTPASEFERPKPLPAGVYHCVVVGQPRQDFTTKKGTPFVEFSLRPVSAVKDVNEADLKAALTGGDGSIKPLSDKRLRYTFYVTPDATFRLKDFLVEDLGIPLGKKKIGQLIAESENREVLVQVKHFPSEDGQTLYANVVKTAPVS